MATVAVCGGGQAIDEVCAVLLKRGVSARDPVLRLRPEQDRIAGTEPDDAARGLVTVLERVEGVVVEDRAFW